MKRLFEAAGVDYVQWRALSRAYVMLDYSALLGAYGAPVAQRAARALLLLVMGLGVLGGAPAVFIWLSPDTLLAATVMTTMTALLVGAIGLSQGGTVVVPQDYAILAFRPISSRTYFAVRATAVLVQTGEMAVITGYLPVVAFLTRPGGSWRQALAAAVAIVVSAFTVTGMLVAGYGWLLGWLRPSRLRRMVAYASTLAILGWTFGIILAVVHLVDVAMPDTTATFNLALPKSTWALLYPSIWFATYVEIARGVAGPFELTAAALSLLLVGLTVVTLRGRLSEQYAARVAQSDDATAPAGKAHRDWRFFRNEARAIITLARHVLRDDMTFHMHVMMWIGITVLYVVFLQGSGGPSALTNPFLDRAAGLGGGFLIVLMAVYLPIDVQNMFAVSSEWEASWLFVTTPSDRFRLITTTRDLIAVLVLAPMLVVIACWFTYAFGRADHAVVHTLFLGAIAYTGLQLNTVLRPIVPFSIPATPGQGGGIMSGRSVIVNLACVIVLMPCQAILYKTRIGTALGLVGLAGVIVALNRLTRWRIERRATDR